MDKSKFFFALNALGPLDGRYGSKLDKLNHYFSERSLIEHRTLIEVLYLLALNEYAEKNGIIELTPLSDTQLKRLENFATTIATTDEYAEKVKGFEKTTNHDVKAVEYAICEFMRENGFPNEHIAHCHFALTSEDVNNLAYAIMLHKSLHEVLVPQIEDVNNALWNLGTDHADTPMLSRTHGQPATPTTFGKEMIIYVQRLKKQIDKLRSFKISVKMNGASGNYCGHAFAYPSIDWPQFMYEFITEEFRDTDGPPFQVNQFTNQIEDHDTYAELFDIIRLINTILRGLAQDIWLYISRDLITQKKKDGEVGSSAMPHKVNPIDFENAEGNLKLANALFTMFSNELPVSRLQRDLSDSTIERNFGVAFGHSMIAYLSLEKGIGKLEVNEALMAQELDAHPEVLTEAIQLLLKKHGIENAYEQMKKLSRGAKVTLEDLHAFIEKVDMPEPEKKRLLALTPATYIGKAAKLAKGFMIVDENYTLKS